MMPVYSMPVRVTFGEGCMQRLPDLPCIADAVKITLIIGGKSLKESGYLDKIQNILAGKKVDVTEGIPAEPSSQDLAREVETIRRDRPDCIVAVGGGSVLDTAKAAAFCAAQDQDVLTTLTVPLCNAQRPIPIVAIPTTAGTGSEVTPFSVFWDKNEKKKYAIHHEFQYPTEALVDPLLTHSMPPVITASTGMDAFTQACEAYWNRNHNPLSDDYALAAIRRILQMLPRAVKKGNDGEARHDVMLGSLEAGLAFSNTRTAACHSISYPMTLYFDVQHGQAVGITLPEVLRLNAQAMPERCERFTEALGASSMEKTVAKIHAMMMACGLKTKLTELSIHSADIDLIVREGFTPERMGNNPYVFDAESLRQMLRRIL